MKKPQLMWRLFKFPAIFFLFLFVGILWQNIMINYEGKELNYLGQIIDVNNHKMDIYGEGVGSPAVYHQ